MVSRDYHWQSRPELDPVQIEEMERLLQESLEGGTLITVTIWKEGFYNKRVGVVKKLNPLDKSLFIEDELGCVFQINFFSITNVAIV